jgi:mannose-6-phosphate isomerase-like protein (cupin superfamily)
VDIRQLDRSHLDHENGADTQRLLPWPALNAPFEGSWALLRPGTASGAHSHHEYEIFIALRGEAVLEAEGERAPFVAGDVARFPPNVVHRAVNESDTDFEMYCLWWDADIADRFTARHHSAG